MLKSPKLPNLETSGMRRIGQMGKNAPPDPVFRLSAGRYLSMAVVGIELSVPGYVHYTVDQIQDPHIGLGSTMTPTMHGRLYRKPFVLDMPGKYIVKAIAFQDEWGLERSNVVSATYEVVPKPPKFRTASGSYWDKVEVSFEDCKESIHFMILPDNGSSEAPMLSSENAQYKEEVLLDKPGDFEVWAVAVQSDTCSDPVCSKFTVKRRGFGERLRSLPGAMVAGMLSIKGVSQSSLAPKLDSMKAAIARAAGALSSQVHVAVRNDAKSTEAVDVNFSVEVERLADATQISSKVTDPSLVAIVAHLAEVTVHQVSVTARARALSEVLLSLGWTNPPGEKDFLDGSCLVYAEDKLVEVVDYRGPQTIIKQACSSATGAWSAGIGDEAALVHSGDVLSVTGGSHAISVRLSKLPPQVTDCFFVLSAYHCRDLSRFQDPYMEIFDVDNPTHLLSRYKIQEAGNAAAVVVCALSREKDVWAVRAFGTSCDGTVRNYSPIEATIARFQAHHLHWRHRRDIILLQSLWQQDRALPRALKSSFCDDVLLYLLDMPDHVFQIIVRFL
eukprot:TRINITY_DN80423_c0_g1_i1.p1 TRINITY_DN80423_c0_g1~~TRINITY_DN80423_c0_g1_i1.p1  ORF type:complete len:589 (+),score=91.63 TRINITY_DN80423_c0_g1_i1:94-1767(+)